MRNLNSPPPSFPNLNPFSIHVAAYDNFHTHTCEVEVILCDWLALVIHRLEPSRHWHPPAG
jgi:hypothetical protein